MIGCVYPNDKLNGTIKHSNESFDEETDEIVLIRIYGKNTEILIDRQQEIRNFHLLHIYGFAPELLAIFKNGLAYEYCSGTPITKVDLYDENVWPLIARRLAEMHKKVKTNDENVEPMLWNKFDKLFELIPDKFTDPEKQAR